MYFSFFSISYNFTLFLQQKNLCFHNIKSKCTFYCCFLALVARTKLLLSIFACLVCIAFFSAFHPFATGSEGGAAVGGGGGAFSS